MTLVDSETAVFRSGVGGEATLVGMSECWSVRRVSHGSSRCIGGPPHHSRLQPTLASLGRLKRRSLDRGKICQYTSVRVGKRIESAFVLHGVLIGALGILLFGICGLPQPSRWRSLLCMSSLIF